MLGKGEKKVFFSLCAAIWDQKGWERKIILHVGHRWISPLMCMFETASDCMCVCTSTFKKGANLWKIVGETWNTQKINFLA